MATRAEVLAFLIPNGGYVSNTENFEDIQFLECEPITKAQYEAGFAKVDAWKAEQDAAVQTAKESAQAKLAALGLTADDLKALGL
jgi:hypothetical protein